MRRQYRAHVRQPAEPVGVSAVPAECGEVEEGGVAAVAAGCAARADHNIHSVGQEGGGDAQFVDRCSSATSGASASV
ncbi:hypothetical protein CBI33_22605 [Rhodococcus erythropolis]|nr:hypothetical protein CBI33_22605 [Rhodococcus erythropolis]